MPKNTIYLIDGTALCYRSFFAIKLSNHKGFPTGAVYGFYRTLQKIITKYKPTYLGVCFDVSRKTFRTDKFKEYKINRPPLPDELKMQIPLIRKLVSDLGIRIVEKQGFEADDVIASLSKKAVEADCKVVIVSSDKDLCQLISEGKVSIYNCNKDKTMAKKDFVKEYGFKPTLMVDYLALAGDSTDNVPGAKGIGKIGAAKLITELGNLENIFNNLDKVPPRIKDILNQEKKNIDLSKELVKLVFCELKESWKDLAIKGTDIEELRKMFKELEFNALLKDLASSSEGLDLEVKSGLPKGFSTGELCFFSQENQAFVYSPDKNCIYQISSQELKSLIENSKQALVSHGLKGQLAYLENKNPKGLFDLKIAAYLLDSNLGDYSLEGLVSHYLEEHFSEITDKSKPYFIYRLYQKLAPKLKKDNLDKLFFEIEMPLVSVLAKMQANGVKVEPKVLEDLLKEVDKRIARAKKDTFKIAGREFNLNSPKQLSVVLFEDLKIKPLKKTKTGYSTNEGVLEKLSSEHQIAKSVLDYRHLNKLKTTYIIPLSENVKENKGLLHAQFNQTATETGRLSSSSPNLQSIPVKGELSFWLRKAFIPSNKTGYIFAGDYSQIELRILAHLSKDKALVEAFNQDLDIHKVTAGLLFNTKPEKIDKAQRNLAKKVNFGIVYGMSAYGLCRELKISPLEAQNFIDDYFNRYPKVRDYINKMYAQAEDKGYVETILGRRRKLPDIKSPNVQIREFSLRQAVNSPIQGSCADIIKLAMVNIDEELEQKKLGSKLIMQIHDELVFDVEEKELEVVKKLVVKHMEEAVKLLVPIKVNIKCGRNWGEME
jgi:DNA polymerase-1